jgi:hypothetical protein
MKEKYVSFEKTINVSTEFMIFLKYHMNVCKQTTPLQVDDLITNKSLTNSEASRRILDTQSVKMSLLANTKNF